MFIRRVSTYMVCRVLGESGYAARKRTCLVSLAQLCFGIRRGGIFRRAPANSVLSRICRSEIGYIAISRSRSPSDIRNRLCGHRGGADGPYVSQINIVKRQQQSVPIGGKLDICNILKAGERGNVNSGLSVICTGVIGVIYLIANDIRLVRARGHCDDSGSVRVIIHIKDTEGV
ncbi:hypothetical protein SDC9_51867 [bioreactor metagenome]|uniref:Uncharacterized protein n=1 Tax=bioreactor metagenome TaxID=1076179 RepID=A0A644WPJ9_9ZZZZ